ncbi:unnamed protein product, partial [Rotaria sp. Silwood2]
MSDPLIIVPQITSPWKPLSLVIAMGTFATLVIIGMALGLGL